MQARRHGGALEGRAPPLLQPVSPHKVGLRILAYGIVLLSN